MKTKLLVFVVMLLAGVWLALPVMAQQQGHTGGLGEARIHLNTSSAANLAKAPGVTPAIAEAIVEHRETNGAFKKPEDLLKVQGITPEVLKQINAQVGMEGELYCVPRAGEKLEEDEDVPLSPSKC